MVKSYHFLRGAILLLVQCSLSTQQQQCSATQLCEAGCCSQFGNCGYGPEFCGDGCLNSCDRKSDCNPGWDGSEWSNFETCPLNVCCSTSGFCGTTDEFCGDDNAVQRPSCSVSDTPVDRVIGYYEAWSTTERSCYGMLPEEIPFGYYTHLNFAFATIDPESFEILPGNSQTDRFMKRIGAIKSIQPDIQIWVAVGGWAFNDPGATQWVFSDLAASEDKTDAFIDSLIKMMNTYGFDGVDIDWEYPVAEERSGREEDYANFVTFLARLRKRLSSEGLKKGVSLTLPSSYWYLQHFNIEKLQEQIDWFNIMSYDIHGAWDLDSKWTGPYANAHTNMTEIQQALDLLWRNDIDPKKVVLGMSYYSRSFTLSDPSCGSPGCRVASAGNAGKCSNVAGVLLHPEIQDIIDENNLTPTLHRDAAVKTVTWGNQWVSFDDVATWRLKSNIARGQCISGVMVWAISQDDSDGTNVKALTSAVGREVMDFPDFDPPQPVTQPLEEAQLCRWSGCYQSCPSGFKEVPRDGTNQIMSDHSLCLDGATSKFCCPSDQELPTCTWRGHANSGWCNPGCEDDEVEVGTLSVGCNVSHQSACCKNTAVVAAYGMCRWQGSAPSCDIDSSCGGDYPIEIVKTSMGAGGEQLCITGSKKFCCQSPTPNVFAGTCKWVTKGSPARFPNNDYICEDSCPEGQIKVATQTDNFGDCYGGAKAYCCDPVKLVTLDPRDDDPYGGGQSEEFKLLIEKYMQNPTCPASVLEVSLGDYFEDPMPATSKRRDLARRATDCTVDDWTLLLAFAVNMFTHTDASLDPFRDVWNEEFAGYYDEAYEFSWLNSFWQQFPAIDIHSLLEHVLYNPLNYGTGLRQRLRAPSLFCELEVNAKKLKLRDELVASLLNTTNIAVLPRVIDAWAESPTLPSLQTILQGINSQALTVVYARWEYQSGRTSNSPPGPILEIAYAIPSGTAGDQYRDLTHGAPSDQYVVFHFHINPENNFLRDINGHTHMGVEMLRVYHGQTMRYFNNGQAPRVENQDSAGLNARDGLECGEITQNGLWWVGAPRPRNPADESGWEVAFQDWEEELFSEGYVSSEALGILLPNAALHEGQIDPSNPGQLLMPGVQNVAIGADPYSVNWVMENGRVDYIAPLDK